MMKYLYALACLLTCLPLCGQIGSLERIEGRIGKSIGPGAYLLQQKDGSQAVLVSTVPLQPDQPFAHMVMVTQYNGDISKPAYFYQKTGMNKLLLILKIVYGLLIIGFLLNFILALRIATHEAADAGFKVKIVSGPDIGKNCHINASRIFGMGRDLSNDIIINDRTVSRMHAQLWLEQAGKKLYIREYDNVTNCLKVNNKQLKKGVQRLHTGDVLNIGLTNMLIQKGDRTHEA